jgi:DnaJ-class molecular chaperone
MAEHNIFELPEGTEECYHCNGYGSSLKDPVGVNNCTKCGGSGVIPTESESDKECK